MDNPTIQPYRAAGTTIHDKSVPGIAPYGVINHCPGLLVRVPEPSNSFQAGTDSPLDLCVFLAWIVSLYTYTRLRVIHASLHVRSKAYCSSSNSRTMLNLDILFSWSKKQCSEQPLEGCIKSLDSTNEITLKLLTCAHHTMSRVSTLNAFSMIRTVIIHVIFLYSALHNIPWHSAN